MKVSMNLHDNDILEAITHLDVNYYPVYVDERYKKMMGNAANNNFASVIIEDDWQMVAAFLEDESYDEPVMTRIKVKNGVYRWVLISKLRPNAENVDKRVAHMIVIRDCVLVSDRFILYFNNVRKYRSLLNHIDVQFFDYDVDNDNISIFRYEGGRSQVFYKGSLDLWKVECIRQAYIDGEEIAKFDQLCADLRAGANNIDCTITTSVFTNGTHKEQVKFSASRLTNGYNVRMIAGVISQNSVIQIDKALYDHDGSKDAFTGLLNKKVATETIRQRIKEASELQPDHDMYLMVIDIDDFKSVNDTYGHKFGDQVIQSFANALMETFGDRAIIGRIGGDEYMCLLTDYHDEQEVRKTLTRMRDEIKVKLREAQPDYNFSVSIGISTFPRDGKDYEALFKITDGALYIAKEKGKDRYIIYNKELHQEHLDLIYDRKKTEGRVVAEFMKPIDKCIMASEMIMKITQGGEACVKEVLCDLMDRMNVHGITYVKPDKELGGVVDFVLGHYCKRPMKAEYMANKKFMKLFDEYGINRVHNVSALVYEYKDIHDNFVSFDMCSSLQIKIMKKKKLIGIICFDTFGVHRRKWSQEDVNTVYMVCKAIESVM